MKKEEIELIKNIYEKYNTKDYSNSYDLFDIDINMTPEEIKNDDNINKLNKLFKEHKAKDFGIEDEQNYNLLYSVFDNFVFWTLKDKRHKKKYDDELKRIEEEKNAIAIPEVLEINETKMVYTYEKTTGNAKYKLDNIRNNYYMALENNIINQGVSETLVDFFQYLSSGNAKYMDNKSENIINTFNYNEYVKLLREDLGIFKNSYDLAKGSLDIFFSRKIEILSSAIEYTITKYDETQAKVAIINALNNNYESFSRGDEKHYGRDRIQKEISPELLKVIIGIKTNRLSSKLAEKPLEKNEISENLITRFIKEIKS